MSPEERQVLVELFQRTNAAASQPRDKDAEAFIAEAVRLQPYAPYLLAQAVLLQEQAMKSASERMQQLEADYGQMAHRIRDTVLHAYLGGTKEATRPTVTNSGASRELNTVTLNSALNGSAVVVDYYESN